MTIHGRDIGFRISVGATSELAEMCPDKDINRLSELMDSPSVIGQIDAAMKIMAIASKWYEEEEHYLDPSYKQNPLTVNELMCLTNDDILSLQNELFKAFNVDAETTVHTEEVKKKEMTQSN